MALQPWIRLRPARPVAARPPFNGAMALQPWILGLRPARDHAALGPSMEPWPFSHGYEDQDPPHARGQGTFNGAMALQPWIRRLSWPVAWARSCLQWSHGPSAMDTAIAYATLYGLYTLQWSHGPSAMDTRTRSSSPQTRLSNLQWSHGPSAMDTAIAATGVPSWLRPSMEPWPFSHGYLPWLLPRSYTPNSFNGAMALQPWIRDRAQSGGRHGAPSMEPWPFSHGYPVLNWQK